MSCEEVFDMMKPSQGIGLTSVYAHLMGREPTFTNHTVGQISPEGAEPLSECDALCVVSVMSGPIVC